MARQALIVGAGIGGLSAAIALRKAGWDVRIFERSTSLRELGFGLGLLRRLAARDHASAAAGQQGWHVRRKAFFVHALDAEDANAALVEATDEMGDGGATEVDGCEIEHDRLADEIARRARQRGVNLREPFHDRHDGAEYERDIGTAAQPDQLTRGIRSYVHDVSTRLS